MTGTQITHPITPLLVFSQSQGVESTVAGSTGGSEGKERKERRGQERRERNMI
jgi:hypothetical protein